MVSVVYLKTVSLCMNWKPISLRSGYTQKRMRWLRFRYWQRTTQPFMQEHFLQISISGQNRCFILPLWKNNVQEFSFLCMAQQKYGLIRFHFLLKMHLARSGLTFFPISKIWIPQFCVSPAVVLRIVTIGWMELVIRIFARRVQICIGAVQRKTALEQMSFSRFV